MLNAIVMKSSNRAHRPHILAAVVFASLLFVAPSAKAQSLKTSNPLIDSAFRLAVWTIDHNTHDGILMDPPSYGRGPGGEVWKLEEQIFPLVADCVKLLSDTPLFFLINSYTTGLSPSVMQYVLGSLMPKGIGGQLTADEIGLPVTDSGLSLPCGATAAWYAD